MIPAEERWLSSSILCSELQVQGPKHALYQVGLGLACGPRSTGWVAAKVQVAKQTMCGWSFSRNQDVLRLLLKLSLACHLETWPLQAFQADHQNME